MLSLPCFLDATDPDRAWRLVRWSWIILAILTIPGCMLALDTRSPYPQIALGLIPLTAHLYVFVVNVPALRRGSDLERIGLTLPVLSYPFGVLMLLPETTLTGAFMGPYLTVFLAFTLLGLLPNGFAVIVALILTRVIMRRSPTWRSAIICFCLFIAAWFACTWPVYYWD